MALFDGMFCIIVDAVKFMCVCTQYFGRDSMIALRFLMPLLTPNATEAALGAVIERANSTGALCHEETIGNSLFFSLGSF